MLEGLASWFDADPTTAPLLPLGEVVTGEAEEDEEEEGEV